MSSWYFQHQRALDIIAEREREAARMRLAYLYETQGRLPTPTRSPLRRAIGGTVLAFGQAVTRVGRALEDAESSPSA